MTARTPRTRKRNAPAVVVDSAGATFVWTIHHPQAAQPTGCNVVRDLASHAHDGSPRAALVSPAFFTQNADGGSDAWHLKMFPNGNGVKSLALNVTVPTEYAQAPPYDAKNNVIPARHAHMTLRIHNSTPSRDVIRRLDHAVLGTFARDWGLRDVLPLDELYSKDAGFLSSDDVLTISAHVEPQPLEELHKDRRLNDRLLFAQGDGGDTCPFCLEDLCVDDQRAHPFNCRHPFHAKCYKEWVQRGPAERQMRMGTLQCPLCKAPQGSCADAQRVVKLSDR